MDHYSQDSSLDDDNIQSDSWRHLKGLAEQHPGLQPHLFDESGTLRSFIRVYVGDEDIHALQGEETPLNSSDEVSIIPAIAGGCGF